MKIISIVAVLALLGCTQLKAVGARLTTKTPTNQVQPGPTQQPAGQPAAGQPAAAGPSAPTAAPAAGQPAAAPGPAMIGGGKRGRGGKAIAKGGPDILGVRLGMTQDEAARALQPFAQGIGAEVQVEPTRVSQVVGYIRVNPRGAPTRTRRGTGVSDSVLITVVNFRGQLLVQKIERRNQSAINPPQLIADLKAKYGGQAWDAGNGNGLIAWGWDASGRPVERAQVGPCAMSITNQCVGLETLVAGNVNPGGSGFTLSLTSKAMMDILTMANQDFQNRRAQDAQRQHDEAAKDNKTSL